MKKTVQIVQVEASVIQADAIQAAEMLKIRLEEFSDFIFQTRNRTTPDEEKDMFWMLGNVAFMIEMLEKLSKNIDPDGAKILLDAVPDAHRLAETLRQAMHGNLSMLPQ